MQGSNSSYKNWGIQQQAVIKKEELKDVGYPH